MNLHEHQKEFRQLITLTAAYKNLPESAIERDYYIVLMLKNLEKSDYRMNCVFKGGTSLSKCYLGTIERFSEDIDLSLLPRDNETITDNKIEKILKRIEIIMSAGATLKPIPSERNKRNKSAYVYFGNESNRIKLEIGSTVRPEPYTLKRIKSYIHEFLENRNLYNEIKKYELCEVSLYALDIKRTFIDKILAIKRHAICGTLDSKVRHIYDVTRLYQLSEIQDFLKDKSQLKRIVKLTKETDSFYLTKRNIPIDFDPVGPYNFNSWYHKITNETKRNYESLHLQLLYTNKKQDFEIAIKILREINEILISIEE